jgi:2-methylaconitate cis-trans-isomerase PrpF
VAQRWVEAPRDGIATVRIWQKNIGKRILSHVPVRDGEVLEDGDFVLDGVAFPSAEVRLEFLEPGGMSEDGGAEAAMFPSGRLVDVLDVPGVGRVEATLITAGNPTVFVEAGALGLRGPELQPEVNGNRELLARCEAIRAAGSVAMGLAKTAREATEKRPMTPKVAWVSPPQAYAASSGKAVAASDIDVTMRMISMEVLHHALPGTGAVAAAVACAVEGTIPHRFVGKADPLKTRIGHPSGILNVGAAVTKSGNDWIVEKAVISRSARRLMEGSVLVPV